MTLLKKLKSHRGGLIRLSTPLYWYDRGGWDGTPGRLCLLLDADADLPPDQEGAAAAFGLGGRGLSWGLAAHLLVDGQPQWVWVIEKDVELL